MTANEISCLKEENFDEPAKFKPERWLDQSNANLENTVVPLSEGTRSFLGRDWLHQQLAIGTAKIIIIMPINQREILSVLAQLAEEKGIKVAVTESLKGAAFVGATTFIGGLLLGPLGLAVGGIAGGITAAAAGRNSFRPVAQVILSDMSPSQQALLAARVQNILREFNVTDFILLLPFIQGNARLHEAVMSALLGFIQSEMNLKLM